MTVTKRRRSSGARHLRLIDGPEQVVSFVPAPILVVRRLADGREIARFPATSHKLARKIGQRWRAEVKVVSGGPSVVLNGNDRPKGSPWAS